MLKKYLNVVVVVHITTINIYRINSLINIYGCDYSQSRIDLGKEKFNLNQYPFSNKLYVKDLSIIYDFKDIIKYFSYFISF